MNTQNQNKESPSARTELGSALHASKSAFVGVAVFSAFINILMLTGPLYMLQVYDRVLASGSMPTLVMISILMAILYGFMGFLEFIRSRVMVRVGDRLETDLGGRTFSVWLQQGLYGKAGQRTRPLNDLSTVRQFLSGAAPSTFFDIPWAPVYIGVMFLLHPYLGYAGIVGAVIIFLLAYANEKTTSGPMQDATIFKTQGQIFAQNVHRNADAITAMGMGDHLRGRWQEYAGRAAASSMVGSDRAGGLTSATKAFRMFVQSAILGLGAALAVRQIITPGTMIAGSIIMGRALAPIQMALGQWRGFISARGAYDRLNKFYEIMPETAESLTLPVPTGALSVENIVAAPPGTQQAVLLGLNFALKPGQGLGVIGPSASGKSTLARLLVGIWTPQKGSIRLDGATYDQWNRNELGPYIGYLPQDVELFDGTIGENIGRFRPDASAEDIVLAARRAGVHDMILRLGDGYDTRIGEGGAVLSGGQNQRIALARALFGDPVLVVLDEPNASLDAEGDAALTAAISDLRRRGKTVVVMAHRPSAIIAVDHLLMLREGKQIAFGPKEQVLKEMADQVKAAQDASAKTTPQQTHKTAAQPAPDQTKSVISQAVKPTLKASANPGADAKQPEQIKARRVAMPSFATQIKPAPKPNPKNKKEDGS